MTTVTMQPDASRVLEGQRVMFTVTVDPADAVGTVLLEVDRGGWTTVATTRLIAGTAELGWRADRTSVFRATYVPDPPDAHTPGSYAAAYRERY